MPENSSYPWVEAGDGVRRRILAHTPDAMTVEVEFKSGAIGEPHSHEHVQTIFCAAGSFRFSVDGEEVAISAGDSLIIPSNAPHGCVALEDGKLIDSFVPRRDDFL